MNDYLVEIKLPNKKDSELKIIKFGSDKEAFSFVKGNFGFGSIWPLGLKLTEDNHRRSNSDDNLGRVYGGGFDVV